MNCKKVEPPPRLSTPHRANASARTRSSCPFWASHLTWPLAKVSYPNCDNSSFSSGRARRPGMKPVCTQYDLEVADKLSLGRSGAAGAFVRKLPAGELDRL